VYTKEGLMNDLKIFQKEEFGEIRTMTINDEPWFVAKDITDRLGFANGRDAVSKHVDDEDKGVAKCDTLGGAQEYTVINESGLYSLVLSSKLESAKKFKRWITHEVIPEIRKTGGYHLPQTYAEALRAYADKVEQNEKLAAENAKLLPKAEFFDAVTDSKSAISIGEVAKVLDVGIGQNKLFAFLREKKILDYHNIPYQEYIDRGYFRTVEQKYDVRGEVRISIKTLVFQKGIDYIRRLLQKKE
jgi:prophage antirepressor-like protein